MIVIKHGLYFVNRGQCQRLSGRLLVSERFSDVLAKVTKIMMSNLQDFYWLYVQ